MRKFDLVFYDSKIEQQYQHELWKSSRSVILKILTAALVVTFIIRILISIIDNEYKLLYYQVTMIMYLLFQYWIIQWKPNLIRIGLIITNISLIGFILEKEESSDVQNLKGSNQMAASIIIILTGEFIDSVLQSFILTVLRIAFASQQGFNFVIIISSIMVNLSLLYYSYSFHKGRRSQFQLSLVQTGWDKIFFNLIKDPCILLEFSFQNLNFIVQKYNKLPFFNNTRNTISPDESLDKQIQNFLNYSNLGKDSLSNYIYNCIKIFQNEKNDLFHQQISAKFQRQIIFIDVSIFQTQSPMILLKMQKSTKVSIKQLKQYRKRFILFNNTFLNILQKIENEIINKFMIKEMKRKLLKIKFIEELLNDQFQFSLINIQIIMNQIEDLYPEKKLIFENKHNIQNIHTINNVLFLLLLSVVEHSQNQYLTIQLINLDQEKRIMLQFRGNFKHRQITKIYENTRLQFRLTVSDVFISNSLIQFILYSEPLCSQIDDIYTYEYQDFLLSCEI